jgi:hypothetical protein
MRVRGWAGDELRIDELFIAPFEELIDFVPQLAARHAATLMVGNKPHTIEFEFLDEPDVTKRFVRFGTDPRRMVAPVAVDLAGVTDANRDTH